jgi:phosphoribosylamine--glycine ligase
LAVIGPEEPLAIGFVDRLEDDLGVACFGPRSELAQIETSKSWARELIAEFGIPGNPEHRVFRSERGLRDYLMQLGSFVVKPDGLTGGKGVRVSGEHLANVEAGLEYACEVLGQDGVVLIEERLEGEEFSLQTITDGRTNIHCPVVQDHKRAREGDTGPNTGGMGSYSCADHGLPFIEPTELDMARAINERVIAALAQKTGKPYRGVLYGGFMSTADGLRLIEYNARFGDPEAMNVLSILDSDLLELCWSAAIGELHTVAVNFATKATVCKYIVPAAYPKPKGAGDVIDVDVAAFDADPNAHLYWAAVNEVESKILMTGSRALAVVGVADSLPDAERFAENATGYVRGPVRHRRDIGTAQALARRVLHMESLRSVD